MTVDELRATYPTFYFTSFSHELSEVGFEVTYNYALEQKHTFTHKIVFRNVTQDHLQSLTISDLEKYLLSIGLAEMLSYWKLTASPHIHISAGTLTQTELDWWHTLLIEGMGEYFFVNTINFSQPNFVRLSAQTVQAPDVPLKEIVLPTTPNSTHHRILVPIGGGKDSAVTLSLLGEAFPSTTAGFMVNAISSAEAILQASNIENRVDVTRVLDPQMLELNSQGFLNGHVPISSTLAYLSVFAAKLFGYTHVAISNERSSNEGNVFYCDRDINHQYSKTAAFEKSFAQYCQTYLPAQTPYYFSFLRPLYELQIAELFAQLPKYHSVFRSCNRGQKTNTWCGECPKCLFAYSIMLPFLGIEKTITIFGKDMYSDASLYYLAEELLGVGHKKPFECVGTHEETLCAFYLATQQYESSALPPLLKEVQKHILHAEKDLAHRTQTILTSWNADHLIPIQFETILKEHMHARQ